MYNARGHGEFNLNEIIVFSVGDADITIDVDRNDMLFSSFQSVMEYTDDEWQVCETLDVRFKDELGIGEGVARDWIDELCVLLFYQSGLFSTCPEDPAAAVHPSVELPDDHETYSMMDFAGRILGIARRLGIPAGVHFSTAAVSMITRQPLDVRWLSQLDPPLAISCAAMRVMDQDDVDLGSFVSPGLLCELFPGGSHVPVRRIEQVAFANLLAECHIRGRNSCCTKACHWILRGMLYVMAPTESNAQRCKIYSQIVRMDIKKFNSTFGGLGMGNMIDVDDWLRHTDISTLMPVELPSAWYSVDAHGSPGYGAGDDTGMDTGIDSDSDSESDSEPATDSDSDDTYYQNETAQVVASDGHTLVSNDMTPDSCSSSMLFKLINDMDAFDRRRMLRFWIGSSSLPKDGFSGLSGRLKLVIVPDTGERGRLPNAHTCVRTLIMPFHTCLSEMRSAIDACLVSMEFGEN